MGATQSGQRTSNEHTVVDSDSVARAQQGQPAQFDVQPTSPALKAVSETKILLLTIRVFQQYLTALCRILGALRRKGLVWYWKLTILAFGF